MKAAVTGATTGGQPGSCRRGTVLAVRPSWSHGDLFFDDTIATLISKCRGRRGTIAGFSRSTPMLDTGVRRSPSEGNAARPIFPVHGRHASKPVVGWRAVFAETGRQVRRGCRSLHYSHSLGSPMASRRSYRYQRADAADHRADGGCERGPPPRSHPRGQCWRSCDVAKDVVKTVGQATATREASRLAAIAQRSAPACRLSIELVSDGLVAMRNHAGRRELQRTRYPCGCFIG